MTDPTGTTDAPSEARIAALSERLSKAAAKMEAAVRQLSEFHAEWADAQDEAMRIRRRLDAIRRDPTRTRASRFAWTSATRRSSGRLSRGCSA